MNKRWMTTLLSLLMASLVGCGAKQSPTGPSGSSSSSSSSTATSASHNAGRNCLDCHSFTVAGTVYKSDGAAVAPGATIRLTSKADATVAVDMTLTADGSGNFYTSSRITFGSGLTVASVGGTGSARTMSTSVTSGACNSCHTAGMRIRVN
jgi:hypothetical protein